MLNHSALVVKVTGNYNRYIPLGKQKVFFLYL